MKMNLINVKKLWWFRYYSFHGDVMAVTNFKTAAESGRFTLKSRSESVRHMFVLSLIHLQ